MDGIEIDLERPGTAPATTAWALIDVIFPENSTITIRVQYANRLASMDMGGTHFLVYNPESLNYFQDLLYWKGPTKFIVEVINDFIISNNVESNWVSDIQLTHINDKYININTKDYLFGLQTLETNLFTITRVNHNTFRINFTAEFMSRTRSVYGMSVDAQPDYRETQIGLDHATCRFV